MDSSSARCGAIAAVVIALTGCGNGEDGRATPSAQASSIPPSSSPTSAPPTSSATPSTAAPRFGGVPVYYVGESQRSFRLFREFRTVDDAGTPVLSAVRAATGLAPLDPDYLSPWRPARRLSVRQEGSTLRIDLSADAFSRTDVGSGLAVAAVQQLVHTATGAAAAFPNGQPRTRVTITVDGKVADAWGVVRVERPMTRAPAADVQAHAWVTSPQEGEVRRAGDVAFTGFGTSFEATFGWIPAATPSRCPRTTRRAAPKGADRPRTTRRSPCAEPCADGGAWSAVGDTVQMRTTGAHVLLTGATGTIGAALARRLAERGARVTLLARSPAPLQELSDATGGRAFAADLCDLEGLRGLVGRVEAQEGPIDILLNNAGAETTGLLTDLSAQQLRATVDLNLTAPLELCRQVLPGMLARGTGHLVNISSLAGVATFPGLAVYGASKAGLTHATSGLRADLRGAAVGTLAVEIGPVASAMMDRIGLHGPSEASFARVLRAGLLRMLDPDEVARRVVTAIERDRPHLRLPRRAAPLAAVTGTPRAIARLALAGIPTSWHQGDQQPGTPS